MILNLSKIKTEALLLFCKDLILSYKDKEDSFFNIDKETVKYINTISEEILTQINNVTFPTEHYLKNKKHYRISAVLKAYDFINNSLTKEFEKIEESKRVFNPSMLYFSMLAVWFKELDKESRSKEYIYFTIYPYANVYDKLLINIKDENFKKINIMMLELAETIIYNYNSISFNK
ncbi:hypothetical protein CRV03_07635 [Arcobacter sp. F155]|uniref:hypothetical protein n=1 Tax=Arcobacteraceae TaxID=2808963 RepID=UPI00100B6B70|nr:MULTISPECIES: hypothetical protein [unclassified Arcobacter]RXJ76715.1 hypothetical protein CRV03_07635 [Arcobacter sp. F155]RXK02244.1 hypothetical protein CRV02_05180 [Arcobacter sp. CECT 8989]